MTDISVSQIAVVALTTENAEEIHVSQLAIVSISFELPFVKIIPPIALPKYRFAAIPFYIGR